MNDFECFFPGREEEFEGTTASDSRSDPDSSEFNWLHSQSLREGEESLQFYCPLSQLRSDGSDDSWGCGSLLHSP